ncbi:hypothetical protein [Hwangdonia seohaensis]|uniref:DUF4868 domain-containing protein n=1 Tax=Hwangdonia seohaensis TaxID=1240727 RepID=A0ABW3RC52_9FLAO|nr:hypothetical protein [Hwangdonia seohaensis]
MKFNNISFPHPVLGIADTISGNIEFFDEVLSEKGNYRIKFELNQSNGDINQLLREAKAEYFCEVTCTNTLYREIFTSSDNYISFELPKKHVKGKVEFTCLLISKTAIPQYVNTDAHSDYDGFYFDIEKGDVLVVFGKTSFNADIKYERLKAVSQILVVKPTKEFDIVNVNLEESKITVEIPEEDYENFASNYADDKKYDPVFHSSIVLNALLIALYNIKKHKDKFWAEAIMYRIENEKDTFQNLGIDEPENVPEIAQRLLGKPLSRLFTGLNELEEQFEN